MKKFGKLLKGGTVTALACVLAFSVVGCGKTTNTPPEPQPPAVTVTIGDATTVISAGETVKLIATVENAENTGVTWSSSAPEILRVDDDGTVSVVKAPELLDKTVTITATSKADNRVTASKTFTVKAPKQEGKNGNLTAEMIEKIGNSNITVSGTVTDYYVDSNQHDNDYVRPYTMKVEMEDGKWKGSWGANDVMNVSDLYERGAVDGVKDDYGNTGHALLQVMINKNNEVVRETIKNYRSVPAVWEAQHYWNHLGSLPLSDFTYKAEEENPLEYTYTVNESNEESVWLMTYLAYSLTPMLEDTFDRVILVLGEKEGGGYEVVGMKAQTIAVYHNPSQNNAGIVVAYDAVEYTTVELSFTQIGTTEIKDPAPYEAPEHVDKLQSALDKMKAAKNYTFTAIDTTTSAPVSDESDYTLDSVSASAKPLSATRAADVADPKYPDGPVKSSFTPARNYNTSVGIGATKQGVGAIGKITEDAILITRTSKYSYGMDDNLYRYENTGYKQIVNNGGVDDYYEAFAYEGKAVAGSDGQKYGALVGNKSVFGHVSDVLPTFDFSPNLFSCTANAVNGKTTYTFTLKATGASRDIAMEVSMYSYAADASSSVSRAFTIVVDDNGNLISTSYPYSIVQGTYLGYVTTTYTNVGTTTLEADTFNQYVARGWKESWSEYTMKYYQANPQETSHDENAQVAINSIFGSNASKLPTPKDLMKIFGDEMSGPFYDEATKTNADGTTRDLRYMSVTARSTKFDENSQITNYEEIMEKADTALGALGFKKNQVLTDITGGASGRSDRYLVYDNGFITVVIENNFTKNFWVYFYNSGEYTRGGITA